MRQLLVLFLLIGTLSVGAQTDKFEKKLKKCIKKQKEMVFICDIPKQSFEAGEYKIVADTTKVQNEYVVMKNNTLLARVKIYDINIIKIEPIKVPQ